jgi:RNA polymerase-binding transcription factor DksA
MATPKKPVAKATVTKKPAPVAKKQSNEKSAPEKGVVAAQKNDTVKKSAPAKAKAPVKKSAPAKAVAPAKKATVSPAKAAAAKKAAPAKSTPAKKSVPVKAEAPKKVTAKTPDPKPLAKKAAPAPVVEKKAPVKPPVKEITEAQQVKKETKAQQRAALKRTASAVQRVQAKVAASIPKPQPKPAPMPTVMPGREEKKTNVVVAHRRLETKPKQEDTSMTMINYQPDITRSILDKGEKDSSPLYRYSDDDLNEFRELISARLATARKELSYQQGLITHKDATGTEDTENRYMNMEDGSGAMEREQLAQLASRQIQFINHLEKAMVRIENKTYGICRVTGKLIDKARLRAVPHATLSIEAKNMMTK